MRKESAVRRIVRMESEAEQLELFKEIIRESLSVRATESASRKSKKGSTDSSSKQLPIGLERIRDRVREQLSAEVSIRSNAKGKGKISIAFDNEEDMKRVLSIMDLWP